MIQFVRGFFCACLTQGLQRKKRFTEKRGVVFWGFALYLINSRRDAEAQRFLPVLYLCCAFWGTLSQRPGVRHVLFHASPFVFFCFFCGLFHAKAQSSQRLSIFCVCFLCFWALRFRKGCVGYFTLRLLLSFVPFVVNVPCIFLAETRRRRGFARSMVMLCIRGFAFAEAIGETRIISRFALCVSYVSYVVALKLHVSLQHYNMRNAVF